MTPTARSPCPGHSGAPKGAGLGEGPKNFTAPNRGPHRAAALQESTDVSLEKHEQLSGGGKKRKKRKEEGEREKPRRLCAGAEGLTVLFLRISPCVISTLGSAVK